MSDQLERAIASAEAPKTISVEQVQVTLAPDGRPAIFVLPADLSDVEAIELVGALYQAIRYVVAKRPSARILTLPGARVRPDQGLA